jgi:hypothetical protein
MPLAPVAAEAGLAKSAAAGTSSEVFRTVLRSVMAGSPTRAARALAFFLAVNPGKGDGSCHKAIAIG